MGLFTAECRWFVEGTPQPPWLGLAPDLWGEPEDRKDSYLVAPHCDTMGLKLRRGKLETKVRCSEPAPFAEGPLVGQIETWHKISIAHDAVEALWSVLVAQEGEPVEVDKRRWLITYAAGLAGMSRVGPDRQPEHGCGVELTELRIGGASWWSLGFEAFGPPHAVRDTLVATLRAFTAAFDIPPLPGEASRGYPAWLHEMARGSARQQA